HELRESVRYRALGLGGNEPLEHLPIELWNNLHTATLEDYRIAERLPDGRRALFHPDIAETIAEHPTGARGGRERPNVPCDPAVPLGVRRADARAQAEGGRCASWVWVEALRNAGWVGAVASDPGNVADLVRTLRDPVTGEKLPRVKGTPDMLLAAARELPPGTQI